MPLKIIYKMPILRHLLIGTVLGCSTFAPRAQTLAWKSLQHGKLSLLYPPSWHLTEDKHGEQTRITLTPDSMQSLNMRIFALYELPVYGDHNYEYFKKTFTTQVQSAIGAEVKFLKTEEIAFKDHKSMCGEIIAGSLPFKVYGIDAGTYIYQIVLIQRRYSQIVDPGVERDGAAILNSITLAP